jgi:catechol 2,3-dioxygenase-like lactoylglutathione lyase family enzyme
MTAPMPRGLDHIVHAVRDLDAAAELYTRLGFTVGARNRHPWGTHNRIVQFPEVFIELLTIGEAEKIAPRGPRLFSFGEFNRDFLARREGFSMLVLESRDAEADAAGFRAAGIGDFDVFHFEREAKRPDGAPVRVAFSLAYANDPRAPEAGFFVCQQHFPENFWNPAFQNHRNGASGVAGVVLAAREPDHHAAFLSAFADQPEAAPAPNGFSLHTPRGDIQVLTPRHFRNEFGATPPDMSRGACILAVRVGVGDLAAVRTRLRTSGVNFNQQGNRATVDAAEAMGAVLIFEPTST